ncbi:Organic hydroperoxide resistance transcriptional regulator [Hyphomicrobium sp. 1Nfss2.1]
MLDELPLSVTHEVRNRCLCLHLQRAARAIARHFDEALRPLEITNGQFSLLISLNRPAAPTIGEIAQLLAMDRTTLTANLKPLERRKLLKIVVDDKDKRSRLLKITAAGQKLLARAVPVWRAAHDEIDRMLSRNPDELRADLEGLARGV